MGRPTPGGYHWRASIAEMRREAATIGEALDALLEPGHGPMVVLMHLGRAAGALRRLLAALYQLERIAANEKAPPSAELDEASGSATTQSNYINEESISNVD